MFNAILLSYLFKMCIRDRPTGGVDPATRRQFWELIYQAADEGITVFVTTHFMDEAEYCDRISIMVDGVIRALDTPGELNQMCISDRRKDVSTWNACPMVLRKRYVS